MSLSETLVELHRRCHLVFSRLLEHCATLTPQEFDRNLEGFGYPSIRLQLHHAIAAERYWIGVLEGRIDVDEDEDRYPGVAELEAFRAQVFRLCARYLRDASDRELAGAREMVTWGGNRKLLVPEHVILRTQTHLFHHQGQVLAMCRLMGKPANGFDYPIESTENDPEQAETDPEQAE